MALVPCSDPTILKVCSTAEAECQTEGIIYELEEREEPTLNESVIGRDANSKTKYSLYCIEVLKKCFRLANCCGCKNGKSEPRF